MDYGKILTRAWQIIWKHKILFVFGILTSCSGNQRYSPNFNFSVGRGDLGDLAPGDMPQFNFYYRLLEMNEDRLVLILLAFFLLAIFLGFIFFLIGTYGQVGLVRGIRKAETEDPDKLTFKEIAAEIRPFFWRLAGFQLLFLFAIMALVILFALVMVVVSIFTLGIGFFLMIPLLCLLVPVMAVVTIIIGQAAIALVVEDLSIGDALARGWQVVSSNWVVYLVMGLILIAAGVVYSLIVSAPYFVAMAPFYWAIISADPYTTFENLFFDFFRSPAFWLMIAYWPVAVILQGLFMTYSNSAWVLTFMEVTGKEDQGEAESEPDLPDLDSGLEPA